MGPGLAVLRTLGRVGLAGVTVTMGCSTGDVTPNGSPQGLRYVALGDSYTIGTSVAEAERWPNQLVERLAAEPPTLELVANLGVNGFTSDDLIRFQLPQLDELRPEFATVLIGVNDVVQGVPEATYRRNVEIILDRLLDLVPADRIVAVSTPDYTVTPRGGSFGDRRQQSEGIGRVNAILGDAAAARGIAFVDIHDLSLRAAHDERLVAHDALHPSGEQYRLWAERIAPTVEELLASD